MPAHALTRINKQGLTQVFHYAPSSTGETNPKAMRDYLDARDHPDTLALYLFEFAHPAPVRLIREYRSPEPINGAINV